MFVGDGRRGDGVYGIDICLLCVEVCGVVFVVNVWFEWWRICFCGDFCLVYVFKIFVIFDIRRVVVVAIEAYRRIFR